MGQRWQLSPIQDQESKAIKKLKDSYFLYDINSCRTMNMRQGKNFDKKSYDYVNNYEVKRNQEEENKASTFMRSANLLFEA